MIDYLKKFRLESKTVAVCGGLGLIGKEVSVALEQAGANVIILDIDKAQVEDFKAKHKNINLVYFDITKIDKIKESINEIFQKNKVHCWINLAYPRTKDWSNKLEEIDTDSWRKNIDMHMNSYCLITKEVAELMKKNKIKGNIINFSSIYGIVAPQFELYAGTDMTCPAAYSAIKAGITNFTRYAASYYGKHGIRVNSICPGGIFNNQKKIFVKNYEKRTPLGRMGLPEDIAGVTLFLASEAASYITGATIMVDGGWTAI